MLQFVGGTHDQGEDDNPEPSTSSSVQQDEPSIMCLWLIKQFCLPYLYFYARIYLIGKTVGTLII